MGPAAPCGLTRYESDAFGPSYQDNVFACSFNLHKVSRHVLTPHQSTFTTSDEDFVKCSDLDFHPTDVVEDADGSLLIVDTGGWYKLCCPTSQLHKPDVLGAIYRVRRLNAPRVVDPRDTKGHANGVERTLGDVIPMLGDTRPAVQQLGIESLARIVNKDSHGDGAGQPQGLTLLHKNALPSAPLRVRRNTVWTLSRIDHPRARAHVRDFFNDPDETIRQAAIHVASVWRDGAATPGLIEFLRGPSAHNRRVAAEALGRVGDKSAVPALLQAAGEANDRILEHSLTYALIEIGEPEATRAGLLSVNTRTKRAALVALDQMDGGGLDPKLVAGLLASAEPVLNDTAVWIVGRHRDWAPALAGVLGERLSRADLSPADRIELERQLGRFADAAPIQSLLARQLSDASAPLSARRSSLQAMAWSNLKPDSVPAQWVNAIARVLSSDPHTAELVSPAVATLRALPLTSDKAGDLPARLEKIAEDTALAADLRLAALAAVPGGLSNLDSKLFSFLAGQLDRERTVMARTTAADVLARSRLSAEQLARLADRLRSAGPLEVDRLLSAFEQSTDDELGTTLVNALANSSALASLRVDSIKAHLAKFGPAVQKLAETLYARLNVDASRQKARLDQLAAALTAGDVRRGQLIFHSEKAACYSCHAIGYRGGNVGPDLTQIGAVRAERDLLEAIVFPSASFVRSFEPIAIATTDGKVTSGLLRGETADFLVLATGVNQEARISRPEIEEMRPGTVSVMPAGLDQQLTPQELADLVAFLKACK
jgi:putative heme-binding domain-containing protein